MGILYHKDRGETDRFLKKFIDQDLLKGSDGDKEKDDLVSKIDKSIEKDNKELKEKKLKEKSEEKDKYEV